MDLSSLSGASLAWLLIFVVTLISIVKNPNQGGPGKVIWILVAFFAGVIGSILWVFFGRGKVVKAS